MHRHLLPVLTLLLATGPSFAAPTATATCLAAASDAGAREACIGATAQACLAETADPTPLDSAVCLNTETEWWQDRLNPAYDRMMAEAEKLDAVVAAVLGKVGPPLTDDLVAMQESWTDWRETRCTFAAALHRGSPERMVFASRCMLDLTAAQVLLLEESANK